MPIYIYNIFIIYVDNIYVYYIYIYIYLSKSLYTHIYAHRKRLDISKKNHWNIQFFNENVKITLSFNWMLTYWHIKEMNLLIKF